MIENHDIFVTNVIVITPLIYLRFVWLVQVPPQLGNRLQVLMPDLRPTWSDIDCYL